MNINFYIKLINGHNCTERSFLVYHEGAERYANPMPVKMAVAECLSLALKLGYGDVLWWL